MPEDLILMICSSAAPLWGGERVRLEGTSLKSPEFQQGWLAPPPRLARYANP